MQADRKQTDRQTDDKGIDRRARTHAGNTVYVKQAKSLCLFFSSTIKSKNSKTVGAHTESTDLIIENFKKYSYQESHFNMQAVNCVIGTSDFDKISYIRCVT